ncbi:MAG: Holliday junction branch migration protein RuvA [Chloroflexota bacterium]|nr:Holliday junction branch migration protein RuvA [Chloroflexota bacterium]
MIASLDGKVIAKLDDGVILDVRGVGYRVRVPAPFLAEAQEGRELFLFTHLAVRENEWSLFGFKTQDELELFELLLTVQGVGPKAALAALSAMEPHAIAGAIAGEEPAILTRIPGVGQKTAQRMVLDLKNKVDAFAIGMTTATSSDADAISALTALGYSVAEAQAALKGVELGLTLEEKIFAALQKLSQ